MIYGNIVEKIEHFLDIHLFQYHGYYVDIQMILSSILIIIGTNILLKLVRRILLGSEKVTEEEIGMRHSLFALLKYFIWVLAFSFVLQVFGISLNIFLAGSAALLVGVGFGLQHIFNDLISGLFLLFERSVKVGDVMEVDGIIGKVQSISLRASVLLTREGVNIIVPNHKFITENVTNWSHNDFLKRFSIEVRVPYGSDIDTIKNLLLECSFDHPDVLQLEGRPTLAWLTDFGLHGQEWTLHFWSKNLWFIEGVRSDLRFSIAKALQAKGITIPLPQLDVQIKAPQKDGQL